MFSLMKLALAVLLAYVLVTSQTGCSEDLNCYETPNILCPPFVVTMECINECVDSATAFQVRIKATHKFFVFPEQVQWVEVPVWTAATLFDTLAVGEYCITIVMMPEGLIERGETVRVALMFEGDYHVLTRDVVFLKDTLAVEEGAMRTESTPLTECGDAAPCPRGSGVGALVDFDLSAGLQLEVFNANDASGAGPVVLFELEWTSAPDTLPSINLTWGDPLLESLPWVSPASNLPATLDAGQPPLVYDIPDEDVSDADVILVRVHSASSTIKTRGIVQADLRLTGTAVTPDLSPGFCLIGNYPDPFSGSTMIEYELERAVGVELTIYDIHGKRVARIKKSTSSAGRQTITWYGLDHRGSKVASGVYLYRIQAGQHSATGKMIIFR